MDSLTKTLIELSVSNGTGAVLFKVDPEELLQRDLERIADNCIHDPYDMGYFDECADSIKLLFHLLLKNVRKNNE